ncbi:putative Arf GTPase activator [Toxoplasma gondii TgCatPRC2]|uniref:Putative Arf GTPase activator n=1 Tax=Toxoplasma gondii TgCatPRC2 TaxID=1130821 RepID=A0A151HLJ6_TOXGO|nr:putative Arf GTPase activator [Toxoplasma gondii TgCatPRC2]
MRSAAGVPAAGPQEGSGKAGQGWRVNPEHSGDEKKITEALQEVLSRAGNKLCADCGAKHPRWASVNLGESRSACFSLVSVAAKLGSLPGVFICRKVARTAGCLQISQDLSIEDTQ